MNHRELFSESFSRALSTRHGEETFFDAFYRSFMDSSPSVRERFANTNMTKQKSILRDSFYHLLEYFVSRQPSEYLRHIARLHGQAHYDIGPEFYDLWLDSILETVRRFDPDCNDDVEFAWRVILSDGIAYMKMGYDA